MQTVENRQMLQNAARQKIASAKRDAEKAKRLKSNPLPNYCELPDQTGDAEIDAAADLDAVAEGFRKRAKDENKRFALATDSEYWACLCFQTREQKEHFLRVMDILQFGDRYLDGQDVAKHLGVTLPDADVPYKTSAKTDPVWVEFTKG
jgi:hypothetical protein